MRDDRIVFIAAALLTLVVIWLSMLPVPAAAFIDATAEPSRQWTAIDVMVAHPEDLPRRP